MKFFRSFSICLAAFLTLGVLGTAAGADAKSTNGKPGSTAVATNSAPPEVAIPQAVFDYGAKGVKDPFFPLSTRSPHLQVASTTEPAINGSTFKLKGLSGSADSPLALINNRTVAPGETALVTTASGRYKIHCLEIKKISVIIRVEGQFEPIEVFLPKSDR